MWTLKQRCVRSKSGAKTKNSAMDNKSIAVDKILFGQNRCRWAYNSFNIRARATSQQPPVSNTYVGHDC